MELFDRKRKKQQEVPQSAVDWDRVVTLKDERGKDVQFEFLDLITLAGH